MSTSKATVTALYQSGRDGKWYVVVKHGDLFEHERLMVDVLDVDAVRAKAVETVVRMYGIPTATAVRMIAEVQS